MRYLLLPLIALLFTLQAYAQSPTDQSLEQLSKDVQKLFQARGWRLNKLLSRGGLSFSDGPICYRIKDSIYWEGDSCEWDASLDSLFLTDENIRDSIVYMLLGEYDPQTESQVMDIYSYTDVNGLQDLGFPNPGVWGEFRGGMRRFKELLTNYLFLSIGSMLKDSSRFTIYFSNRGPNFFDRVVCDDMMLQEALSRHFVENEIKYLPPIGYARLLMSYHVFEVKKTEEGLRIDDVGYGEPFFYKVLQDTIYVIEPLYKKEKVNYEASFLYDSKWTEQEFLASSGIKALLRGREKEPLTEVLKQFCNGAFIKPFSAIYGIREAKLYSDNLIK
ncbi:hypothetical protein [Sphingobacterium paucimobilis]|uniref:Uncharacterized protein n=1 Tax=Sphingobacterium paucimobilis HER1398 TaxID=1346330 RepID=U2HAL1_9SPHI|nr:hypothetical protein [Sphingobacterium paucimobilis]ERJ58781.1 hypothetical protein M472_08370 [Sphingobacterium paucimobilis HER1398]